MENIHPTVASLVREKTGLSWSRARKLCADGRVTVDGERCLDPAARVRADAAVAIDAHAAKVDRGPLARDAIVFHDRDVVVVDKPPGMLTVGYEGEKDSLAELARLLLRRLDREAHDTGLGVVHRLDKETSGLVAFTRTAQAKRELAAQFRAHDLERSYLALAQGIVPESRIETFFLEDRGDGLRGSWGQFRRASAEPPAGAKRAVTHVAALEALEGATLVECRLETGRQHQIRIHLAELGHPVLGEKVYIRDFVGERLEASRMMLHARTLGFAHPRSGKAMRFEREAPEDFRTRLDSLRRR
ncbi:MAG TPA: RluA family pseudouridine synthase [Usitatibacter sp.]|jgi:23S rRNA pseudouridine1911/1915/1917 synthase|nr:RluA family pseudouridine synthase [Usitatibacter sp.]